MAAEKPIQLELFGEEKPFRKKTFIPPEARQAVVADYVAGVTPTEIRKKYGYGLTTIARIVTASGVPRRPNGGQATYDWSHVDEVVRARVETDGAEKLAAELGLTRDQVYWRARQVGISLRVDHDWNTLDEAIRQRFPQEGPGPICREYDIPRGTIARRASELGVRCLTHGQRRVETKRQENTSVNHAYFDTWTANMAWLVGYTWTDGTVSVSKSSCGIGLAYQIRYRCKVDDEHIIHDIRRELQSAHVIQRFDSKVMPQGYVAAPQAGIGINSKQLCESLIRIGVIPNKSNLNPPMPDIPAEVFPHFVRGVIDGDGSILRKKTGLGGIVCIVGTHLFLSRLGERIAEAASVRRPKARRCLSSDKIGRIDWSRGDELIRLLEWIYPTDTNLALNRKMATARDILERGVRTRSREVIRGTFLPTIKSESQSD